RPMPSISNGASPRPPHSPGRPSMPATPSFDYAVVRIVPRVEREEFINAGVILFCLELEFLEARVSLDSHRVLALFPDADLGTIEDHLHSVPRICAGGEGSGPI